RLHHQALQPPQAGRAHQRDPRRVELAAVSHGLVSGPRFTDSETGPLRWLLGPLPAAARVPPMASYAHVALPLPLRQPFVYRLPDSLLSRVRPGSQVQVPFRGRPRRGIVVELAETNGRADAQEIGAVLGEPLFDRHLLE